ncbi:MAG: hypothetical protein GX613_16385 [Chloroflexi bacterium]|nr:hypothetical protein [Chloroflexota bacterium]
MSHMHQNHTSKSLGTTQGTTGPDPDPEDDDVELYLGPDGHYYDPDDFGANFGMSPGDYQAASSQASDFGFPDAESYLQWLDD